MYFSPLPSPHDPSELLTLARVADAHLAADPRGTMLRVREPAAGRDCLAWLALDHRHPVSALRGFVAPADWRALGVCVPGRAHGSGWSDDVAVTLLVDRAGASASLLRRAGRVEVLPGRPEGALADTCRRALGLPTAPPPATTLGLWTLTWLDRVVAAASGREPGQPALTWAAVSDLHPAGAGPTDPAGLALAAARVAVAWTWARLRADAAAGDLPGPAPPVDVAAWMDDGMWARWLLERLPPLDALVDAVHYLLPPAVASAVQLVVDAAVDAAGGALTDPET